MLLQVSESIKPHTMKWREIMTNPIAPIQYPTWQRRPREQQDQLERTDRLNRPSVNGRFEKILKGVMTNAAHQ
jgi:hypothetical protein